MKNKSEGEKKSAERKQLATRFWDRPLAARAEVPSPVRSSSSQVVETAARGRVPVEPFEASRGDSFSLPHSLCRSLLSTSSPGFCSTIGNGVAGWPATAHVEWKGIGEDDRKRDHRRQS